MRVSLIRMASATIFALMGVAYGYVAGEAALLAPLMTDWDQYLTVDWQATQKAGRTVVTGTVRSTSAWGAKRIQLLIDGLDPGGQVVTQRVEWLGSDLTPGSHAYFEVPVAEGASRYRVRVFAFDPIKRC